MSTYLDPRFSYVPDLLMRVRWTEIEESIALYSESLIIVPTSAQPPVPKKAHVEESSYAKFVQSKRLSVGGSSIQAEMASYKALVVAGRPALDSDPVTFWRAHRDRFPLLQRIALHFLSPTQSIPRLNCATITSSQCNSPTWRVIIAQDCPASCGFCNEGGCVDAVTNCETDLSICTTVGMQDFVNTYCQRTCNRCPSTTAASGIVTSTGSSTVTCTSYIADTTTQCAAWAANGFCTNTFYTSAQRRARCATTCRIC
ncbi:Protein CBG10350 [Caenorhabditis briggsae]|uniref:Protein CBG10350 n=1 Tax=Caenorhabditis briggsae TaxID=6238 RepID=A8XB05_CAEBR|nr:Protein CBG10350 [Caenorhabditis briggsae]CAP29785.2 Protein CBG10350 [Caenorhabditis briggsae]